MHFASRARMKRGKRPLPVPTLETRAASVALVMMMSMWAIALGVGRLFIMTYQQNITALCYNAIYE